LNPPSICAVHKFTSGLLRCHAGSDSLLKSVLPLARGHWIIRIGQELHQGDAIEVDRHAAVVP